MPRQQKSSNGGHTQTQQGAKMTRISPHQMSPIFTDNTNQRCHCDAKISHKWLSRLLPESVLCRLDGLAHWMSPMPGAEELPP